MEGKIEIGSQILSSEDIQYIRYLITIEGKKGRTHLSKRLCQKWDWKTAKGLYRDIACRRLLRELDRRGLIELPPAIISGRRPGYINKTNLPKQLDRRSLTCTLSEFSTIDIQMVRGTSQEKDYNGLIGAFNYLGYHQQGGEQLKYLVYGDRRLLACTGFGASAYKVRDRDCFIGWTAAERKRNLQKVVNNHRFLILPWVRIPNLASYLLGKVSRRIQADWWDYYRNEIFLLETFVEQERFQGTCYRAANWIRVGQTTGRGRFDRYHRQALPIKDVYLYPLVKHVREALIR